MLNCFFSVYIIIEESLPPSLAMLSLFFLGAVKFGEPLGLDECRELVLNLSKCQLPFQCAHGR